MSKSKKVDLRVDDQTRVSATRADSGVISVNASGIDLPTVISLVRLAWTQVDTNLRFQTAHKHVATPAQKRRTK